VVLGGRRRRQQATAGARRWLRAAAGPSETPPQTPNRPTRAAPPPPDNFLFLSKSEDSPLKATDFGLSIRHSADEPKLTSRSGTPAYMAPELVMQCYGEGGAGRGAWPV
jgi:hypothetical protein